MNEKFAAGGVEGCIDFKKIELFALQIRSRCTRAFTQLFIRNLKK